MQIIYHDVGMVFNNDIKLITIPISSSMLCIPITFPTPLPKLVNINFSFNFPLYFSGQPVYPNLSVPPTYSIRSLDIYIYFGQFFGNIVSTWSFSNFECSIISSGIFSALLHGRYTYFFQYQTEICSLR